ncbi:MAG: isoprenyl transferase [Chitinophagaceae bacterium]|nr:isoprenyl transferase [Chitinophagaceae bacterium]
MSLKEKIDTAKLPRHIAIIMDGNGRWAKDKGHDRLYGHFHGVESVRNIVEGCAELGVKYLTLYAFSTENWDRPKDEVTGLMELLVQTIRDEVPTLNKNNIRLQVIGDTQQLPENARNELAEAIKETSNNTGLVLIMAISYSSRWEIADTVKRIAKDIESGAISSKDISADLFAGYLRTADYPDPELVIRTSGEYRISNFLLYQIAYSELYFTPTLWPDFRKEDLYKAILDYQSRERRFGKTSEQVS